MRFLEYNIWDGCQEDSRRRIALTSWVKKQGVDVAAMVELNGWCPRDRALELASWMGFDHVDILYPGASPYLVGVFSRQPILRRAAVITGVHHGILHVSTSGLDVIVSHWSPNKPELRVSEAAICAEMMASCPRPALLAGDLNSHSPRDRELCEKFATTENMDWAMDFRAQSALLAAGLHDLGDTDPIRWSTATSHRPDEPKRRLDYIYANREFMKVYPNASAQVIHGAETASLSDHFPVIAALAPTTAGA